MRRRVLLILAITVAVVVAVVISSPLWLGLALSRAGRAWGLTFDDYRLVGYSRFALTDVKLRHAGIEASAARVEATTPIVWSWKRLLGGGGTVSVSRWSVDVQTQPRPEADRPASTAGRNAGWMPLRTQLLQATDTLAEWLPQARAGAGTVRWTGGELVVGGLTWENRRLAVDAARYRGLRLAASLAAPADSDVLEVSLRELDEPFRATFESRGANVRGEVFAWDQRAPLSARFAPEGWIPEEGSLRAEDWKVPGTALKLGNLYATVLAGVNIEWNNPQFEADIAARGQPVEENSNAPPLALDLHARGDAQTVTVESLAAQLPGVTARLNQPVTVNRRGDLRNGPAHLRVRADLAEQPWFEATGSVEGEATIESGPGPWPTAGFHLRARDVHAHGVAVASAEARGEFEWPRVQITSGTLIGADGKRLEWHGGWNLQQREIVDAGVSGEISRQTLARWLPEQPQFESISIEASASGPVAELEHSGSAQVADLELSGASPLDLFATWRGRGAALEELTARAEAGGTTLRVAGAVDPESARLEEIVLARNDEVLLRSTEPATVRWRPTLTIDSLRLEGPTSRITADMSWGASGHIDAAATDISSAWLEDIIALPGPDWRVDSLALNADWDRGPMELALTLGALVEINAGQTAAVHLAARGGEQGLHINALRATENRETVFNATGRIPLAITPAGDRLAELDPQGALALDLTAAPHAAFWEKLADIAGIELAAPRADVHVSGTWRRPEGEARVQAERVSFDAERFERELPAIDAIDVRLTADREHIDIARFHASVEDQIVRASGRLPIPDGGWSELVKQPLAVLEEDATLHLEVPGAELEAFENLLPAALAPAGTLHLEASYRDGALAGELRLRNAATRPLGPLGILQEINAEVRLDNRTVVLDSVTARSGGERVTLTGTVELPRDAQPRYDLELRGQNLPFVRRVGLLVRGDLDLTLKTPAESGAPRIGGRVRLRDSLFLRDLRALLPQAGGGGGAGDRRQPPYFSVDTPPFASWQLAVELTGEEFMRFRTPVFRGVASANFALRGTLGEPRAIGQVTVEEGEVLMPFASFEVQQGTARLTEENPHEAAIYLRGATRKYGYDLTLEVDGTASSPNVEFSGSPPLDAEQVLLMVTAGIVPTQEITYSGTQRATRIGSFIGRSLIGSLGGDSARGDRLTIESGREVSRQGRETYNVEYEISDRWSAVGEYNEFDEYNAGIRWRIIPRAEEADDEDDDDADGQDRAQAESEAEIDVSGVGWLRSRELRLSLERLLDKDEGVLDGNTIDDAAVILLSALVEDGFQEPVLEIETVLRDGSVRRFDFDPTFSEPLPRPLAAKRVEFHLAPGLRWHIAEVNIDGLTALPREDALGFFRSEQGIFGTEKANAYSGARVNSAEADLLAALERRGYIEASVEAEVAREIGGAVTLDVEVDEGRRWEIESVRYTDGEPGEVDLPEPADWTGRPLTRALEQDFREAVRQAYYRAGHPDAGVHVEAEPLETEDAHVAAELVATIAPGPRVSIGEVRFEGNERTKDSVLRRRVQLESGDPLNPVSLERARYRISRLGVFKSVDLHYEPPDAFVRDPVFVVEEGPRLSMALLLGYGSFEQIRAGVEIRQMNFFGLAHQSRLRLVQSMKSTDLDLTYSVPELFGESIDGSAELFALRREEIAFRREEYGTSFTLRRPLPQFGGEAFVRYSLEELRNRPKILAPQPGDERQIDVASLSFALTRDKRDNPLQPRHGYDWAARFQAADPMLGGDSTYQRLELFAGYHTAWGNGRWVHAGLSHGVITTIDGDDSTLPVNRRFFPGGDVSIRGYQNGEAAPRDPEGRFIGAKSYLLLNFEIEQALTTDWSVVAFIDALGETARLGDYPFNERLYSAGLGLRYRTIIGPVRLEYGRNLNPRPEDPSGTWHLSIGYPF